jgi:hypothetical protein
MPAASALSTKLTPDAMGNMLAKATRYTAVLIFLTGLPLLVVGGTVLRVWVGPFYASHSVRYLQLLVLANMLRNMCLPYSIMVMATGKQRLATVATISEATVNLGSSIYLARTYGAVGVAIGTLLGALISVSMHFAVSMRYTWTIFSVSRTHLFVKSFLRPAVVAIPTALLIPLWWKTPMQFIGGGLCSAWLASTLIISWFGVLNSDERNNISQAIRNKLSI